MPSMRSIFAGAPAAVLIMLTVAAGSAQAEQQAATLPSSSAGVKQLDLNRDGTADSQQPSQQKLVLNGSPMSVPFGTEGYTDPTTISCQSAGLYGNYSGGRMYDRYYYMTNGTRVGWRYNTSDGRASMVLDYNPENQWGFVWRYCLTDGH